MAQLTRNDDRDHRRPLKHPVYARTDSGTLVVVGEGFRDSDGWVTIDLTRDALPDKELIRVKLSEGA